MLCLNLTVLLLTMSPLIAPQVQASHVQAVAQKKPVLSLFYSNSCPYCQDVLNYLKKIHKQVPMKNVQNSRAAYDELSHLGEPVLVPCLLIDGRPLYDSVSIIQWISQHQDILDPA